MAKLLKPHPDQRLDRGAVTEPARRRGNRTVGFGAGDIQVFERGNRIGDCPRDANGADGRTCRRCGLGRCGNSNSSDLVAQFVDDARGKPRPDPVGTRQRSPVLRGDR